MLCRTERLFFYAKIETLVKVAWITGKEKNSKFPKVDISVSNNKLFSVILDYSYTQNMLYINNKKTMVGVHIFPVRIKYKLKWWESNISNECSEEIILFKY